MKSKNKTFSDQQPLFFLENSSTPSSKHAEPLAQRMRPRTLQEFIGQSHLLSKGQALYSIIQHKIKQSLIFWGPPGCGKTTLAHLVASECGFNMIPLSAVLSGLKEVRDAITVAENYWFSQKKPTVLFIDEIHRFNKAQQDALLPHVESGVVTLIGATTENPSFAVIAPLLSRVRVMVLNPLTQEELMLIVEAAITDKERGLGNSEIEMSHEASEYLCAMADRDARVALSLLDLASSHTGIDDSGKKTITIDVINQISQTKTLRYDKTGEEHYNLISALHKSLRGGDPDAGLYYLARMMMAGDDPLYIGRRLVRFASEDVGLADPLALNITLAAVQAYQMLGSPEGDLALAEAVVYLATCEKSNAIYRAYDNAKEAVTEKGALAVPLKLRNAPTKLMKSLNYGKDYKYPHDYQDAYVDERYLPEELNGRQFYFPTDRGQENIMAERLQKWRRG